MGAVGVTPKYTRSSDSGFTLIELLVVVLIIGILVSLAIPVYADVQTHARSRACFSNQRAIQGVVQVWLATNPGQLPALEGVVDVNHPLLTAQLFARPPRCTSAPIPPDLEAPDAAHGAYTLDASGTVEPCAFGGHGYFARLRSRALLPRTSLLGHTGLAAIYAVRS